MKNKIVIIISFLLLGTHTLVAKTLPFSSLKTCDPIIQDNYGNIVWYNLVTPNIANSKEFYGDIFDWTFEDIQLKGQNFAIIKHDNIAIGSMLEIPGADASIWLASISVNSIKDVITRYTDNGGRLLIEPFNVMGTGEQVILEGPLGEKIAYINNPASPVSLVDNGPDQWIWTELWSNEIEKSKAFYETVWNVKVSSTEVKGKPYWYFEKDSKKVAGMIKNPAQGTDTQWVPYVNIKNIDRLHKKLERLNVNIMLSPQDVKGSSIIVFQDPNGATVSAQNYSK